jgi:hypothetical protein
MHQRLWLLCIVAAGCVDHSGQVTMAPVMLGEDVVAIAVDVVRSGLSGGALSVLAKGDDLAAPTGGATARICIGLGNSEPFSYHVWPAGSHFDQAVRLHAVLTEGTCTSPGTFVADAVYPVSPVPGSSTGSGGGGVVAGSGGAGAGGSGGAGGAGAGASSGSSSSSGGGGATGGGGGP